MGLTETQTAVRDEILAELPSEWDISTGSIFWNIVSALAVPVGDEVDRLEEAIKLRDPWLMTGDELDIFCRRYGIYRTAATEAETELRVTLDDEVSSVDIADGTLFETEDGIQFAASQDYTGIRTGDLIAVHAVVAGAHGNVAADKITVIPVTAEGVAMVTNPEAATGGSDEEDDIDLLERWQIKVSYRLTGYNKGWYEALALEQPDVGYAKCYAAGETLYDSETVPSGYVYLVVLDDGRKPLSAERLAELQELLDPAPQATGLGKTPATAFCMVQNGVEVPLTVTISGLKTDGSREAQAIAEAIADFTIERLDNTDVNTTVYTAEIFADAMSVDGVVKLDAVTIDGRTLYSLKYNEIPTLSKLICNFETGESVTI